MESEAAKASDALLWQVARRTTKGLLVCGLIGLAVRYGVIAFDGTKATADLTGLIAALLNVPMLALYLIARGGRDVSGFEEIPGAAEPYRASPSPIEESSAAS